VTEHDIGAELTVDHFHPRSRGGAHEPQNWVYCCHACNEFKADHWQPDSIQRVLHPLHDDLTAHILEQEDGRLRPLTETGAFHIARLHLNRQQLVEHRIERRRLTIVYQKQVALIDELERLEDQLTILLARLEELMRKDLDD
jgi:hypothetical protein